MLCELRAGHLVISPSPSTSTAFLQVDYKFWIEISCHLIAGQCLHFVQNLGWAPTGYVPDVSNASLKKNLILFKIGHSEQVHNDDPENNNIMMKQWPMVLWTEANVAET